MLLDKKVSKLEAFCNTSYWCLCRQKFYTSEFPFIIGVRKEGPGRVTTPLWRHRKYDKKTYY